MHIASASSARRLPLVVLSVLLCPLALAAPARAQQEEPSDTLPPEAKYTVPEIPVTVTRAQQSLETAPFAVSVVGEASLQDATKGVSLEEGLRSVPGLDVQNRQNFSLGDRITMRGVGARSQFGVRGIQIIADGIPLTMPDGQAQLTNLDLGSLGRVEVIRGAASTLYGNASGGVLSFHTKNFPHTPVQLQPKVTGGSDGYLKAEAGASGRTKLLDYVLHVDRLQTDGFRDHGHAKYYRGNLVVQHVFSDDTRLHGVMNFFRMPFGENPSSLDRTTALNDPRSTRSLVIQQGLGEEDTQGQLGLSLQHDFSAGQTIQVSGWGLFRNIWNPIPFDIIDIHRGAGGLRSQYEGTASVAGRDLSWTTGVDFGYQHDARKEYDNAGVPTGGTRTQEGALNLDQTERVLNLGPFAQLQYQLLPRWSLVAGGRLDAYGFKADDHFLSDGNDSGSRNFTQFSPMAGVSFRAAEGVHLYGHYATAFETPTTSELSNRPDGSGGFNPNLSPETTKSFEAGAKGWLEEARVRYDLAMYTANVRNALLPFEASNGVVYYRNAGQLTRRGVEMHASWYPLPRLEAQLSYTLQHSTYDRFVVNGQDVAGNFEPGIPEHQIFGGLTYTAPFGLRSEANVRWTDAFFVNDQNTASNWSSRVVDLRFSLDRAVGRWRIAPFLGIDNVFDERYNSSVVPNAFGGRYYEPAPGRSVYGGLSLPVQPL